MTERHYRNWVKTKDLVTFKVKEVDSDLLISAPKDLSKEALASLRKYRKQIESYIERDPEFKTSLKPLSPKPLLPMTKEERIRGIIPTMLNNSQKAKVGPMAAVAGAVAEFVGRDLLKLSREVIVENGGDIFMKISQPRTIGLFAGSSKATGKLTIDVSPQKTPLGICTSSGTVGHSLSFGKADAAVVISKSTALADAAATACGNMVRTAADIKKALAAISAIYGIRGIMIVVGPKIGLWGNLRMLSKAKFAII